MASISNENVAIGDTVYDVTQGSGTVVSTMFNSIQVKFKNGVSINYDDTGHYAGVRRLYWHNPVVLEPPKDRALWDTLSPIITSIHNLLKAR